MRVTAYLENLKSPTERIYRLRLDVSQGETNDCHTLTYDYFSCIEVIKLNTGDFFNSKWDSEIIFHIYWKIYFYRSKIIMKA